jgi:hypothetical protein
MLTPLYEVAAHRALAPLPTLPDPKLTPTSPPTITAIPQAIAMSTIDTSLIPKPVHSLGTSDAKDIWTGAGESQEEEDDYAQQVASAIAAGNGWKSEKEREE